MYTLQSLQPSTRDTLACVPWSSIQQLRPSHSKHTDPITQESSLVRKQDRLYWWGTQHGKTSILTSLQPTDLFCPLMPLFLHYTCFLISPWFLPPSTPSFSSLCPSSFLAFGHSSMGSFLIIPNCSPTSHARSHSPLGSQAWEPLQQLLVMGIILVLWADGYHEMPFGGTHFLPRLPHLVPLFLGKGG